MSTEMTPIASRPASPDAQDEADIATTIGGVTDLSLTDGTETPLSIATKEAASDDDEELERFRNEWKRDLTAKRADAPSITRGRAGGQTESKAVDKHARLEQNIPRESGSIGLVLPRAVDAAINRVQMPADMDDDPEGPSTSGSRARPAGLPGTSGSLTVAGPSNIPRPKSGEDQPGHSVDEAVALYTRAVESEQAGKLNEALMMYRKAFKLSDDVDRLYARSVAKAAAATAQSGTATPSSTDVVSPAAPLDEPYSFQRHIQLQPDYVATAPLQPTPSAAPASIITRPSPLTALLTKLPISPDQTAFLADDERLPVPLALLPLELLDPILAHLDVASIERFGSTCWRARYVTAASKVWRRTVEGIYRSPAILPKEHSIAELVRRHRGEWRTTLVEEERVRMDGCYISVCHYIRPGAGDQWVTITHMITYHRFLRFYPDGSVISFLTTDHPSEVVPLLRPNLRAKGLHFGRWNLIRSDDPVNHEQAKPPVPHTSPPKVRHRNTARIVINDLLEPGSEAPKYEFEMELGLKETGRGRWNKLDLLNYNTINLSTGESLGLSLKHQKPFYFSKVKSYHPQL